MYKKITLSTLKVASRFFVIICEIFEQYLSENYFSVIYAIIWYVKIGV